MLHKTSLPEMMLRTDELLLGVCKQRRLEVPMTAWTDVGSCVKILDRNTVQQLIFFLTSGWQHNSIPDRKIKTIHMIWHFKVLDLNKMQQLSFSF